MNEYEIHHYIPDYVPTYSTSKSKPSLSVVKKLSVRDEVLKVADSRQWFCEKHIVLDEVAVNTVRGRLSDLAKEGLLIEGDHVEGLLQYRRALPLEVEHARRVKHDSRVARAVRVVLDDARLPTHVMQVLNTFLGDLNG